MLYSLLVSAAIMAGTSSARSIDVQVGPGLTYNPKTVTAAVGDT